MNALYAGALLVLVSSAVLVEGGLFRLKRDGSQCAQAENRAMNACPSSDYPKLVAVAQASEDNVLEVLSRHSISDYCSEITSSLSCNLNTIKSFPKECMSLQDTAIFDVITPMLEKVQDLAEDICTNDVQVIQSNIGCLTSPQRMIDDETCDREISQGHGSPSGASTNECEQLLESAFCMAAKVEEDSHCQKEMAAVMYKIAFKVYEIVEPMCQGPPGHLMEKAQQILKLF